MSGSGADVLANEIFDAIMADVDVIDIPDVNLDDPEFQLPDIGNISDAIIKLTNDDLTEKTFTGEGTFDVLLQALRVHLQREFESNRITGDQYAKVYMALVEGAMNQAVQFLVARDTTYWQSVAAQHQALTARIQLVGAKVQLSTLHIQAQKERAEYALTKLKLATEDKSFGAASYTLQYILPQQLILLREQAETARAQTMDTRSDGITNITGSVGKQKALYEQQITSYQRDSEVKAAKIFIDAWTVMKTIDEGLLPPTGFNNTALDEILATLKTANGLD